MRLESIPLVSAQVGWGSLGMRGDLGYEGKVVRVRGQAYAHALSTHPPARVAFRLERGFASFRCQVALNDDVPPGRSHADFFVYADGREVGCAPHVVAGEGARTLCADVSGARTLELEVRTTRWEHSHAVWLDPEVSESAAAGERGPVLDCLNRVEIAPSSLPLAECCIATVASPGFERWLDNLLGSVRANAGCEDALLAVFGVNPNAACERVAAKYGAALIPCRNRAALNPMIKALLYSAAHVVNAQRFVFLDADMLVLASLRPLFAALDACAEGSILACREGNGHGITSLRHALEAVYGGSARDLETLGITADEAAYPLVVNDGLFAASRASLLALDGCIRGMPSAAAWADGNRRVFWRNQFIFNLALARMRCGVELEAGYNLQLHAQDVALELRGARLHAQWRGQAVRVAHFSGGSKHKYTEYQSLYGSAEPVQGP